MRLCLLLLLPFLLATAPAHAQSGVLVEAREVAGAPQGSRAWQIRYTTLGESGQSEIATGMVMAPATAEGGGDRPVLAWTHGTWGVVDKCAPSLSPNFFKATPIAALAVQRGFVVVAPDYAGLGSDGPHPYLGGSSAARATLDAVRAARALSGANAGRRFAVWGESQGGHAALFTGHAAASYAPDLELAGTAAAAPPTDLIANLTGGTDASVRAFLTAFVTHSWSRYYRVDMATIVSASTARLIDRLAENNCISLESKPKVGTLIGIASLRLQLRRVDLGKTEPWRSLAVTNSVPVRGFRAPVLIAQAPGDAIVAEAVTKRFARSLCRAGTPLRYITIRDGKHETSAIDTASETLDWIAARFVGTPPSSDCATL